jgi:hypothetical protein
MPKSLHKSPKRECTMWKSTFSFLLLLLTLAPFAAARTIGVPGDSSTIQAGIDASSRGDTVLVQPGRYLEIIDFKGKDIVVGSLFLATRDSAYILNTIIDANQKDTVVAFQTGETAKAQLAGFTITNGKGSATVTSDGRVGGGIFCINSSPYLHHLIIEGNYTQLEGGGMYLQNSNSVIEYCVISNNRGAMGGGGLEIEGGNHEIRYCVIDNNDGGGINCGYSTIILFRSIIINNKYNAFNSSNSNMNIINCTIVNNDPEIYIYYSNINIVNSIFWNISPQIIIYDEDKKYPISHVIVANSDFKRGVDSITIWLPKNNQLFWNGGNIDKDPDFKINYSLNSLSPCIDAGISFYQVGDSIIVNFDKNEYRGQAPDMGAFESNYNSTVVESEDINKMSLSNSPNPFNSSTTIHFSLSYPSHARLSIYTITGQKVIDLIEKSLPVGNYQAQWNGVDKSGNKISSGIYILRMDAGIHSLSRRLVYMK